MKNPMRVDTLRELVAKKIPVPPEGGTIQVSVHSVGRDDWYWFHVEHTRDGRAVRQPVNVSVKLGDSADTDAATMADEIVSAIEAQFARQQDAD